MFPIGNNYATVIAHIQFICTMKVIVFGTIYYMHSHDIGYQNNIVMVFESAASVYSCQLSNSYIPVVMALNFMRNRNKHIK